MNTTLKYSILSLCFIIVGFLSFDAFFSRSVSQLHADHTVFSTSSLTGLFDGMYIYCIAVGSIPLLYLLTNRIAKLQSRKQATIVYSTIIATGLMFWQLRINDLNSEIEPFSHFLSNNGIQNSRDINRLYFSEYAFIGLISGALVSSVIFKLINRKKKTVGNKG